MIRKWTTWLLLGLGFLLLGVGFQKWYDSLAPVRTVDAFLKAVQKGEREKACDLLHPDRQRILETQRRFGISNSWEPRPGFVWETGRIRQEGDRAAVQLRIRQNGHKIEPVVHLQRDRTGCWKIEHFGKLKLVSDAPELSPEQKRLKRQGEHLARELTEALQNRPGDSISRLPQPHKRR